MRTETFSTATGIVGTVRERTGMTDYTAAQYLGALRRSHPELLAYEKAMLRALAQMSKAAALSKDIDKSPEYIELAGIAQLENPVGTLQSTMATNVTAGLSRIVELNGAPFNLSKTGNGHTQGRLSDADLEIAFQGWLDDDFRKAFWNVLFEAIERVDAPLTNTAEKPPEALTSEERTAPLS